jgi:Fe-S-cluster-containing dehydrogenase component
MYFGDLEDRSTEVAHLARNSRAFRVMDELGTGPNVIYLKEST